MYVCMKKKKSCGDEEGVCMCICMHICVCVCVCVCMYVCMYLQSIHTRGLLSFLGLYRYITYIRTYLDVWTSFFSVQLQPPHVVSTVTLIVKMCVCVCVRARVRVHVRVRALASRSRAMPMGEWTNPQLELASLAVRSI